MGSTGSCLNDDEEDGAVREDVVVIASRCGVACVPLALVRMMMTASGVLKMMMMMRKRLNEVVASRSDVGDIVGSCLGSYWLLSSVIHGGS